MECKQDENFCNFTYPGCSRHGKCCECLDYHRNNNELPACYFSSESEKTYDRSFKNFFKDKQLN